MIYAVLAAVSAPGVWLTWWLLRLPARAVDVQVDAAEPEGVRFGLDHRGLC